MDNHQQRRAMNSYRKQLINKSRKENLKEYTLKRKEMKEKDKFKYDLNFLQSPKIQHDVQTKDIKGDGNINHKKLEEFRKQNHYSK